MLFDLRGRGRRRVVKVIYLGLALLMGGGLVLFGIGSDQSGGLVDAFKGDGSGGSTTEDIDKRIEAQLAVTKKSPKDPKAWAELARLRFQRAGIGGTDDSGQFSAEGKTKLRLADQAWQRHLALNPDPPDDNVAKVMAGAYLPTALNEPTKAVRAQEIVTEAAEPPSSNLYQQLAQLAYTVGETRSGDLASARAVDLAPAKERKQVRDALEALKTSIATQQAQPQTPPSG